MNEAPRTSGRRWALTVLAAVALIGAAALASTPLRAFLAPEAPELPRDWSVLVKDIRDYERQLGFRDTPNFATLATTRGEFLFCTFAPQRILPYSYEDPAIVSVDAASEAECRKAAGPNADVYFGAADAVGEANMQITPAMLASRLDRFVYLVMHEDCHDQFDLPWGIEEALCDVIAYRGMVAYAADRYPWHSRERRAIQRYAESQGRLTPLTIHYYGRLEALYARLQRKEIGIEEVLRERKVIYAEASRALDWQLGEMNNVNMANYMTYSRHYPALDRMHAALGGDLARTVAFFRQVDKARPSPEAVMKRHGLARADSAAFLRAYEAAVLETASGLLTASGTSTPP